MKVTTLLFIGIIALANCTNKSQSIRFFGNSYINSKDAITIFGHSGSKGIFKKADLINDLGEGNDGNSVVNSPISLMVKLGSEVELNGTKMTVGKDLPDPQGNFSKSPTCKCQVSCGQGICCAVAGFKMVCGDDGVCQYTMDTCSE